MYKNIWFVKLNFDIFMLYGPMTIMVVFNDYMNEIFAGTLLLTIVIHFISMTCSSTPRLINFMSYPNPNEILKISLNENKEIVSMRIHPITDIKALCMTVTCIAIMVVDFPPLFNRKLVKTEDEGWSLMDVGVSSIMLTTALSSKLCITYP